MGRPIKPRRTDQRWYIVAHANTCYDKTGITHPQARVKAVDFEKIVREHGGKYLGWSPRWGWHNQPDVLSFRLTVEQANALDARLTDLPVELLIHWRECSPEGV